MKEAFFSTVTLVLLNKSQKWWLHRQNTKHTTFMVLCILCVCYSFYPLIFHHESVCVLYIVLALNRIFWLDINSNTFSMISSILGKSQKMSPLNSYKLLQKYVHFIKYCFAAMQYRVYIMTEYWNIHDSWLGIPFSSSNTHLGWFVVT